MDEERGALKDALKAAKDKAATKDASVKGKGESPRNLLQMGRRERPQETV